MPSHNSTQIGIKKVRNVGYNMTLENKIRQTLGNFKLGIGILASALSLMGSELMAQSVPEKEAAIKQLYTHSPVKGAEYLDANTFKDFIDQSNKIPSNTRYLVTYIQFITNSCSSAQVINNGASSRDIYNMNISVPRLYIGDVLHESSHIYSGYKRKQSLKEFTAYEKLISTNALTNNASSFRWPDGGMGSNKGSFTSYGEKSREESLAEGVRVITKYPDQAKEFLNPQGKFYDKRLVDQVELLNKQGFITPETYNTLKQKTGI